MSYFEEFFSPKFLLAEIFFKAPINITADGNEFDDQIVRVFSDFTTIPNGNNLGIMQLNNFLSITPRSGLPEPWTFLFSTKLEEPLTNNNSSLTFTTANQTIFSIIMRWSSRTLNYAIPNQNETSIDFDTTKFIHIAFEYVGNKLTVWVNGKSRKSHNVDLGKLTNVSFGLQQLGVVSLYNRELSKTEVAEHFVEYQVKNFSNDEVLI